MKTFKYKLDIDIHMNMINILYSMFCNALVLDILIYHYFTVIKAIKTNLVRN